jgi:DNA polymerase-4
LAHSSGRSNFRFGSKPAIRRSRSQTGQALFSTRAEIEQVSHALLEPLFPVTKGIRLLGMTLSSLGEKQLESEPQLRLSF